MMTSSNTNIYCDATDVLQMFHRMRWNNIVQKKNVRKLIRQEMSVAQSNLRQSAKNAMAKDPRGSYKAVKLNVYRDGNGAMVSILSPHKAGKTVVEGSHSTGGKSGIKRKRKVSDATNMINGYRGKDRAFILCFINNGARRSKRGIIAPRGFFGVAESEVTKAKDRLMERIGKLVQEVSQNE